MVRKYHIQTSNKQLHPRASKLVDAYSRKFENSLRLQAQIVASQSKADLVMSSHVEEALEKVKSASKRNWSKEIGIIVGSAMFGAFLQGFITELYTGNALLIAIYTSIGILGMLIVFWAVQK